jgi:hypothetical protein
MTEYLQLYINSFRRDPPSFEVLRGVDAVPNFFADCAKWSLFFTGLMLLTPVLAKQFFPTWHKQLDKKKKGEFPPYAVSMIHHVIVVPYGWYYFIKDLALPNYDQGMLEYTHFLQFLTPIIGAFIVADTLCYALPESLFHNHHEYIIHHILAMLLFVPFLYGPGALVRFYPHLIICETTNLLFNIAWLLRLTGHRDSLAVTICEIAFAVMFFLVRFVNLSFSFLKIFFSNEGLEMGIYRFLLPPISALQWYWMGKIVQALYKKFGEKAPKHQKHAQKPLETEKNQ